MKTKALILSMVLGVVSAITISFSASAETKSEVTELASSLAPCRKFNCPTGFAGYYCTPSNFNYPICDADPCEVYTCVPR